ncbi:hypothetical protein B4O97_15950 [Marispirochaeta aestuarii]|uniref:Glycosyltransferase 2-like domain-containing protein n=1 Tax=Marispirochaeta aestuarii TaxID=1963862 RepID=A0A1Y1RUE3_9SPIO|nr:glycosyltransferase [Marispirochaeta aestuarii]ORC32651.1 hypothetical protein B4O97_15950 [Marispirochaeta aestuarii]
MISVVMPAHNEEKFIARSLRAITKGAPPDQMEVVVVCNGCSDKTAEVARSIPGPITVIESDIPSKVQSLNIGDKLVSSFPRFYVDSDIIFTFADLKKVADELEKVGVLAAAPEFIFDDSTASSAVKAYYRVWRRMPYFESGRIAGAYGLSEEGRRRFEEFPDIIADDGFVRLHFHPSERVTVKSSSVVVTTPRDLANLIKIKSRSHGGTYELRKKYPKLFNNETTSPTLSLKRMIEQKVSIKDSLIYIYVSLVAKFKGKMNQFTGRKKWERDESSRIKS